MIIGFEERFKQSILDGTKKHTIREDKKNRYSGGCMLHLSVGVRTKKYRCLRKTHCTCIQDIHILYGNGSYCDVFVYQNVRVIVDDKKLSYDEITKLAENNGFDNQDSFFRFFNKNFTGKIIHWAYVRY